MLNILQKMKDYIPPVVWDTAATLIMWIRQILRGSTPKIEMGPKKSVPRISKLDAAKQILKVGVGEKEDALKRRSLPNERLAITFKIENAFTTMSLEVHQEYVTKVHEMVKIASFYTEHSLIKDIFETEKQIFVNKYGQNLPFKQYILTASFKFAIKRFLREHVNSELSEKEMSDLCLIAGDKITLLWLESKSGAVNKDEQEELFAILGKLFPELNVRDIYQNPLGIILPSFETFWRVVYRLCVTIQCNPKRGLYRQLLRNFGENPCEQTYFEKKEGISVEFMAKDILFINPPTRTIYRTDKNNNLVGVDILKLHLDQVDAKQFYPERWGDNSNNKVSFLTFGYGCFMCPAKKFAPIAIGLIGATIFDIFENYHWDIDFNEFNTTEEKNDRDKYFEFEIKRMK